MFFDLFFSACLLVFLLISVIVVFSMPMACCSALTVPKWQQYETNFSWRAMLFGKDAFLPSNEHVMNLISSVYASVFWMGSLSQILPYMGMFQKDRFTSLPVNITSDFGLKSVRHSAP